MDTIISFLEKLVHYSAELGIVLAELAGIAILIITAMKGVVSYFKHDEVLRLELAQGIGLRWNSSSAAKCCARSSCREWTELLILGAVIALRGVLTLLLHWEIKVEEEHDERLLKPKRWRKLKKRQRHQNRDNTNSHLKHVIRPASFPPRLCFVPLARTSSTPRFTQLCRNEKSAMLDAMF